MATTAAGLALTGRQPYYVDTGRKTGTAPQDAYHRAGNRFGYAARPAHVRRSDGDMLLRANAALRAAERKPGSSLTHAASKNRPSNPFQKFGAKGARQAAFWDRYPVKRFGQALPYFGCRTLGPRDMAVPDPAMRQFAACIVAMGPACGSDWAKAPFRIKRASWPFSAIAFLTWGTT